MSLERQSIEGIGVLTSAKGNWPDVSTDSVEVQVPGFSKIFVFGYYNVQASAADANDQISVNETVDDDGWIEVPDNQNITVTRLSTGAGRAADFFIQFLGI